MTNPKEGKYVISMTDNNHYIVATKNFTYAFDTLQQAVDLLSKLFSVELENRSYSSYYLAEAHDEDSSS